MAVLASKPDVSFEIEAYTYKAGRFNNLQYACDPEGRWCKESAFVFEARNIGRSNDVSQAVEEVLENLEAMEERLQRRVHNSSISTDSRVTPDLKKIYPHADEIGAHVHVDASPAIEVLLKRFNAELELPPSLKRRFYGELMAWKMRDRLWTPEFVSRFCYSDRLARRIDSMHRYKRRDQDFEHLSDANEDLMRISVNFRIGTGSLEVAIADSTRDYNQLYALGQTVQEGLIQLVDETLAGQSSLAFPDPLDIHSFMESRWNNIQRTLGQ
jgi:hypothetical protein